MSETHSVEPQTSRATATECDPTPLRDLAILFVRLGLTAFGGPAAHIAMMEHEVVRRRGWMSRERFLDLLGATNLIPGPNSTEMAIHIGWDRARWAGLVVAGLGFILPSSLIVLALAWAYARYGAQPETAALLYGIKPVVIALVIQALWGLGRVAVRTKALAAVGLVGAGLNVLGVGELTVLFGSGAVVGLGRWLRRRLRPGRGAPSGLMAVAGPIPLAVLAAPAVGIGAGAGAATVPFHLGTMFLIFLKIGSVLFGSGYVLLAFLQGDFVERRGWLTETELLDAVAIGQVTPGPLSTTATFIGYLLGGTPGAAVATLGIFLPSFVFVALSGPLIPRIRRSATAGAVLDGVNVAALALMAVVTGQLGHEAVVDLPTGLLALACLIVLIRFRLNSIWLVLAGAVFGLILYK